MACVSAAIGAVVPSLAVSSRIPTSVTHASLQMPCIQSRRLLKSNVVEDFKKGVKLSDISSRRTGCNVTCAVGTETGRWSKAEALNECGAQYPPRLEQCGSNALLNFQSLRVLHTSASLTINENASSDVPLDMEDALNRIVPEVRTY